MLKDFNELMERAQALPPKKLSVAVAQDEAVISAVKAASEMGFVKPVLVGNGEKIREIAKKLAFADYELVDTGEADDAEAVKTAVELVRNKSCDVLMKGLVNTSIFMKGVLNKEYGLRTQNLLSLLAVYELPQYHKLLYCSDSGINVAPDVNQKKMIMENAVLAMKRLGVEMPKVAILTANEMVNPKIISTVDAAALVDMVKNKELPACIAEGPIAFDVAFDKHAAEHKGIDSQVAGDVDLLIFPTIEAGNILGKSWLRFNQAKWAGLVLGAAAPVVLGSRSDTAEIKINSIAMACLAASDEVM